MSITEIQLQPQHSKRPIFTWDYRGQDEMSFCLLLPCVLLALYYYFFIGEFEDIFLGKLLNVSYHLETVMLNKWCVRVQPEGI